MKQNKGSFDRDEYLHLAIEASGRGDHGAALSYLKEGRSCFPDDARMVYLLGAEYAQIGLFDRAEAEMAHALELDSTLYTACFQLGLLQMTLGRIDDSRVTWVGLDVLPEGNALRKFRSGLEALALNHFSEAMSFIKEGIAANDFSADLNRDMELIIERIGNAEHGDVPQVEPSGVHSDAHMWLSAYKTDQPLGG